MNQNIKQLGIMFGYKLMRLYFFFFSSISWDKIYFFYVLSNYIKKLLNIQELFNNCEHC